MSVTQRAEAVQTREQFVVLLRGLGEAEAGVEDDVFTPDARGEHLVGAAAEIADDLGDDVAPVVGLRLHGFRIALHVHGDVGYAAVRNDGEHRGVEFPGRNVVDDERPERFDSLRRDFAAERVDRDGHAGRQPTHGPDAQPDATPLLVGGDFVGPGTRGVAPDVDQLRPFGHGFADAALDGFGLRSAAAGIERIGGDVKNRHHLRRGKINVHGLHG